MNKWTNDSEGFYTRSFAISSYFRNCIQGSRIIEKIQNWSARKTLEENRLDCGISTTQVAYMFAKRFDLKYVKIRKDVEKMVKLKELGFTYKDIGRLFKITKQRACQLVTYERKKRGKHENRRNKTAKADMPS